ncbi:hypothetical protein JKF63_03989 [Porcisia hertigi]|uniref:Maf1 regulator n=1 Tax=Porcisia hertigi TaxID=2761500 RepID=A0A836LF54_9TRYP|nr:hypothetical protein JKF63_03989 [Porcisia hertigi]
MKFIPLDSFSALNSLLQGVEAQGCCITMRLEAYTCRHTKEERQIANNIAFYQNNVPRAPPLSPLPGMGAYASIPPQEALPPLVMGGSAEYQTPNYNPVSADEIDDRLVYFVAVLNTLYECDGYDFSVLGENDFVCYTEPQFRTEVSNTLQSLPEQCSPAVQRFWSTLEEVVERASSGCEYYEFRCPSCDPLADTTVYARHYFVYNRRKKVLVLLVEYGESNPYRGDDGLPHSGVQGSACDPESPTYASTPDVGEEGSAYEGGKNRDFYGYY